MSYVNYPQKADRAYYIIDDVFVADASQLVVPSVHLNQDTTLCPGQSLAFAFDPNPAIRYRWQDGSTKPAYTITQPGTYWVSATAGPLSDADTIRVTVEKPIRLPADTLLCRGETLTLNPHYPGKALRWSDGSTDSTLTVSQAGTYTVQASSAYCTLTDSIQVELEDCPGPVPNVFTPNGDGKNDAFVIEGILSRAWHLQVTNRWGQVVYEAYPYRNDWRAERLPAAVYYYLLWNETLHQTRKGWVQVLK